MYEILIRLGIPKKLIRLIQICLANTRDRVKVVRYQSLLRFNMG